MKFLSVLALALSLLPMRVMAGDPMAHMVKAEILPGWRLQDGSHMAGLRLVLADGWKTYWRAPGDAGIPPVFRWQGSRNLSAVEVRFPTPVAFSQNGMRSIGYLGDVLFPLHIRPETAGDRIWLSGEVDIGICKEICVPRRLRIGMELPAENRAADPAIAAALAERPYSADEAGVRSVRCAMEPTADGMSITANIKMPSAGGNEIVVVETSDPQIWVAEASSRRSGGTLEARTEMMHMEGGPVMLDRSGLRLTVLGRDRAVDIRGCPSR